MNTKAGRQCRWDRVERLRIPGMADLGQTTGTNLRRANYSDDEGL